MANQNDSFIDEVTEDLRRDRLFTLFRRYGWIEILLVLGLVGGTVWTEYSKSRAQQQAQNWGDAVLAAQKDGDPVAALGAVDSMDNAGRKALSEMLAAGAEADAGQTQQAQRESAGGKSGRSLHRRQGSGWVEMPRSTRSMWARMKVCGSRPMPGHSQAPSECRCTHSITSGMTIE
jgi:hypothetical protein